MGTMEKYEWGKMLPESGSEFRMQRAAKLTGKKAPLSELDRGKARQERASKLLSRDSNLR